MALKRYDASFFTATILNWNFILNSDEVKDFIIDSLRHLVEHKKVLVHAYVIMNNHIHLVWHIAYPNKRDEVQAAFLKYTARSIIAHLKVNNLSLLCDFQVNAKDRKYQIWERNPLTTDLWTEEILKQKIDYVHLNPVKAGLCSTPEDYKYSSAALYSGAVTDWGFVSPYFF